MRGTTPPTSGETTITSESFIRSLMSRTHDRRGEQIVGRDIEEALDLAGVQVDGQHAVGAGVSDHVGDELGRDRRARPCLAILTGVAEIGDHGGDALAPTSGGRHPS